MKSKFRKGVVIMTAPLLLYGSLVCAQEEEDSYSDKVQIWKLQKDSVDQRNNVRKAKRAEARKHFLMAVDYFNAGQFAASVDAFREALSIDSTYSKTYVNLAVSLKRTGDSDQALAVLDRGEQVFRNKPKTLAVLSETRIRLLTELRRFDEALLAVEVILKNDPAATEFLYLKGKLLKLHYGRGEEAVGFFEKTLKIDPAHAGAAYELTNSLNNLGNHLAALEVGAKALKQNLDETDKQSVYFEMADASRNLGKNNDAIRYYRLSRVNPLWREAADQWLKLLETE